MSDPEPVGHALHDARVLSQGRDRMHPCQHGHDIMAYEMVAHIDNVILLPDPPCGMSIVLFKSTHRFSQHSTCLLTKIKQPGDNGVLGDGMCDGMIRWTFSTPISHNGRIDVNRIHARSAYSA